MQAGAHRIVPVEHQTLEVLEEQVFVLVQEALDRIPEGGRRGPRVREHGEDKGLGCMETACSSQ